MNDWRVKLLYDGQCPFCAKEVRWLKSWDRRGYLALEDISDPRFDPAVYGLTRREVTGVLHAVLPSGRVVRRLEALRHAYRAVGLGPLAAPTAWPGVRWIADGMYAVFSRYRRPLGKLVPPSIRCTCGAKGVRDKC
jgi:predicted DCC family thiol-disulfide oxidoreductase YuxK